MIIVERTVYGMNKLQRMIRDLLPEWWYKKRGKTPPFSAPEPSPAPAPKPTPEPIRPTPGPQPPTERWRMPVTYEGRRIPADLVRAVLIAEFLEDNGYRMTSTSIDGGISEVSHTGTVAYGAHFSDAASMKTGLYADYNAAWDHATEQYGDWCSDLDYSCIHQIFEKDGVTLCIGDPKHPAWYSIPEHHPEAETVLRQLRIYLEQEVTA